MAAGLRILDGNPIWLSPSIIPSKDTVVSPMSSPTLAAIKPISQDIFIYVKVDNTGTVDFGSCACSAVGAWTTPTTFAGFRATSAGTVTASRFGTTFTASPGGDSLSGAVNHFFGISASGRRAWDWSADGNFFAYVGTPNGNDWFLTIIALQNVTRTNGTVIPSGQEAISGVNGLFSSPILQNQFGWAGSKAVVISGPSAVAGSAARVVACPLANPSSNTNGTTFLTSAGQVDYVYLVSPCAGFIAIVPKILNSAAGSRQVELISTATAASVSFRKNNANTTVDIFGNNPSITTNTHTANGIHVNTGVSPGVDVDDPECTSVNGGVIVHVDRVKASTLPSANLGVVSVGDSAATAIKQGQSAWVQVPNTNTSGWANQGESHWCLLAQAFTADGTTIPRAWNGQAASPPAFPISNLTSSQRNVDIA